MHLQSSAPRGSRPDHFSLITSVLFGLLLLVTFAHAQTAVVLAPVPQLQFFDQSGNPLAFGCVFTYQVNTTTPLVTYTDYTGTTQNSNPVILSAGGSANIWLAAGQAYTFRVIAAGGSNCASGSTLYTVNGIGGGATTLTTNVTYSSTPVFMVAAQVQLFTITLTGNASAQPLTFVGVLPPSMIFFQITQDASGGHTFSWPVNSIGGCTIGANSNQVTTQEFMYDGANATAIGPCVTGNGPSIDFGNAIGANLLLTQTLTVNGLSLFDGFFGCAEGTALTPLTGFDWMWCDSTAHRWMMSNDNVAADTVVGAVTTDIFQNKTFNAAVNGNVLEINSDTISTVTGNSASAQLAGTNSGTTGAPLCDDANKNATTTCANLIGGVNQFVQPSGCSSSGTPCTVSTNWGTNFADTSYYVLCTPTSQSPASAAVFWISTKNVGSFVITISNVGTNNPGGFGSFDCWGHHP